jgi:hypothetical protein
LPHLATLAAFGLVTALATWPMLPRLGGFVVSKLDPLYSVWAMAWQAHALGTNPAGLFDTNVMYPFKGTLAFDELSFAEAVISAPLYWLTGNPVLSHNAQLLATFVVCGYGMWLLVRELTGSGWAGLVGGSAYAFSFYRFDHLPHMTLLSNEWLPFMLLCAYKLLWTGSWRWAAGLGAFFVVQALSSHYLAFYSVMLLGLFVVFYAIASGQRAPEGAARKGLLSGREWLLPFAGKVALAVGAGVLVLLPVIIPYVQVQSSQEFTRGIFEVERYSNTLASFVSVYQGNPIYQQLLAPFADPGPWPWERAAFPGLVAPLLAVVAVVGAGKPKAGGRRENEAHAGLPSSFKPPSLGKHVGFFSLVALFAAFLSLGPTLQLTFAPSSYDPTAINGIVPLPYALMHEWLPGFKSMRVVARIDVLTSLGLGVLAGIGAHFLLDWARPRITSRGFSGAAWQLPAVVLAVLPVVESWSAPVYSEPVGTRQAVPAVYRWLAEQPRTVVLEYPMVYYKRGPDNVAMQNTYQYYSSYHWQYTVNGSTTIRPYAYSALVNETEDCFPCPRSLDALWALGVEYVVAHLDNLSGPQRTDFLWRSTAPEGKVVGDFTMVKDFGSDRVYKLKPRPVVGLADQIPRDASILLADPAGDSIKSGDQTSYVGGGYVAALGYLLRANPQYGDPRLSFGQPIASPDPTNPPDYAVLWANQDPNTAGYLAQNRVWANDVVALYKRGPGKASQRLRP